MTLAVRDATGTSIDLQSVAVSSEQIVTHANPGGYIVDETGEKRDIVRANVALTDTGELVAAPGADLAIRVIALFLSANGDTNGFIEDDDGAASQNNMLGSTSARFSFGAGGGFVLQRNDHGWFQANANHALNLDLSAAAQVIGSVIYIVVDDVA